MGHEVKIAEFPVGDAKSVMVNQLSVAGSQFSDSRLMGIAASLPRELQPADQSGSIQ